MLGCACPWCLLRPAFAQSAALSQGDVSARIGALESSGRARPAEAAHALEALRTGTGERSTERLELLTVEGLVLAVASNSDAERTAEELTAWSTDADRGLALAAGSAALLVRARATARGGNLTRADALLEEALARLPRTTSARARYRFVSVRGYVADASGRFEDAVRLNHEALALADQQDALWVRSEARTALASSYFGAQQYERARAFIEEALALAEKAHDWVSLARAHNVAGIVLDALGDKQAKRRGFEQAIDDSRRAGSTNDEARYLANLADFHLGNSDYHSALMLAARALPLARQLKDVSSEMIALCNIGLAHIGLGHLELGRRYVRESLAIDAARGATASMADTLGELGAALEKAGDASGAVAAYHEHRRLVEDILRDDQQKAILAMQERYDAERRAKALELLGRENELKAEQLRRRELQKRRWQLVGAALLLLFAAVTLLYRRVRVTNQELAQSNTRLEMEGQRDPLTGLANRRHFQAAMREMSGDGTMRGSAFLLDIDHFKSINDRHGHAAGDLVLVEVARRLRGAFREDDLVVRWGGEEFLVVAQTAVPEDVDALAQRMIDVLQSTPIAIERQEITVTGSIGFATFPIGPSRLAVAWPNAVEMIDAAMYLAKARGRNRAYGVRVLEAVDEAALHALASSLEGASKDGRVALSLLEGASLLHEAVAA